MADEITLLAESRDVSGSGAARRLRRTGVVPAIFTSDKGKAEMIQLNGHDFELLLQRHHGESLVLDLHIGEGKARKVLLKEVQHDSLHDKVLHADFLEISMTKRLRVGVPLNLVGEPVGVIADGGTLNHLLRELEIECLPLDIPEEIILDVSALTIGNVLRVSDVTVDPKLEIITDPAVGVAGVEAPRVEEEPEGEEEEGLEGEPEVIGEKEEGTEEEAASEAKPESDKKKEESGES